MKRYRVFFVIIFWEENNDFWGVFVKMYKLNLIMGKIREN